MSSRSTSPMYYEIRIAEELGAMWGEWFEGLSLRVEISQDSGRPVTVLYGPVPDQPALHGLLNKIRDLNLVLLSVKRCEPKE